MLINRNFRYLWVGQAISLVGDFVFMTTVMLWVAAVLLPGERYAPAATSAVLGTVAASTVLAAPVAGVLVDRWDKRRVMLAADLLRFLLVGALTVVALIPRDKMSAAATITVLIIVVAAVSATAQFFNPARLVTVADIVPGEAHGRAFGYLQATMAGAAIIGPPLAAPLLFGIGVGWALGVNAVSFLVSFIAIRLIDVPAGVQTSLAPKASQQPRQLSFLKDFVDGLKIFRGNRVLKALLVVITLVMLGAGAVNSLDVYFLQENLHAAPKWFGLLGAAFGVGALVGSVFAGVMGDKVGHARTFCLGLSLAALFFLAYSRMTSLWPAIALVALFSVGLGAVNSVAMPLVLKAVPRAYLARVSSVLGPLEQLAVIGSAGVAGLIVSTLPLGFSTSYAGVNFGRIDLIFSGSAILMLLGALYAIVSLRGVDRLPTAQGGDALDKVLESPGAEMPNRS